MTIALLLFLLCAPVAGAQENKYAVMQERVQELGGFPVTDGNTLELFTSGKDMLPRMLEDIRGAKTSIEADYYWFDNGKCGREVMDALVQKAREGVPVRLIIDNLSVPTVPESFYARVRKYGGEFRVISDPDSRLWKLVKEFNHRDHRKVLLLDGTVAYTGGINIKDDCMLVWEDAHMRLTGPVAASLRALFEQAWQKMGGEKGLDLPAASPSGAVSAQLVPSGKGVMEALYVELIGKARKNIFIHTPYLCPVPAVWQALKDAVKRGVEVFLVVPHTSDWPFMNELTRSYFKETLDAGIRVFEQYNAYNHAKYIIVDDDLCSCGTVNLDRRSFELNDELCVLFYGEAVAGSFLEMFNKAVAESREVDDERSKAYFQNRLYRRFLKLFTPLL